MVVAASFVLALWVPQPAVRTPECECTPLPAAEALAAADAVFEGKLTGWAFVDDAKGKRDSWGFRVSQTWKRELPSHAAITIPTGGCPIHFGELGEAWLIYATIKSEEDPDEVRFEMAACPRMLPLASAADEIAALGDGTRRSRCSVHDRSNPAAGLALLCGLGLLRVRRRA